MFTVILYGLALIGALVVLCIIWMVMWYYGLFTKVEKYKPSNYHCLAFHKQAKPVEKTFMKPFGIGGHTHKYYMQCGTCEKTLYEISKEEAVSLGCEISP